MSTEHRVHPRAVHRKRIRIMVKDRLERTMMASHRNWFAAGAVMVMAACGSAQADGTEDAEASDEFVRVINVQVAPISTERFVEEIRLTAVAVANRDVMIEAEESGKIVEVLRDRGDRVAAGTAIAKIDDAVLVAQVAQARAAADLASQTWDRRRRLFEEDGVGSEIAYLEARFAAEQSAAALAVLEERLDRTVVRAPFAGVLDERHVDVGTMVGPGKTIGRIVELDPIKVVAGVPERYAADVAVGAGVDMVFDALGAAEFEATIRYVSATVDPRNRTFGIEAEVPNGSGVIKPQMVANASLARRVVDDAVVVPQDALIRVEGGYVVFVVAEHEGMEVAEVRQVTLGPARRNLVVIESGVVPGERLVVVGQKSVADGDRVNVVER
jgi:membrane fusion protein (multidrug efflux system)